MKSWTKIRGEMPQDSQTRMDARLKDTLEQAANNLWRVTALLGASLVVIGVSAFYIDVAARFRFDFIEQHYGLFGWSILSGVVLAFVGCIGWAKAVGKNDRRSVAAAVFVGPWILLLVGSFVDKFNVHGPSAISAMLIFPATILAVTLLLMAAVAQE